MFKYHKFFTYKRADSQVLKVNIITRVMASGVPVRGRRAETQEQAAGSEIPLGGRSSSPASSAFGRNDMTFSGGKRPGDTIQMLVHQQRSKDTCRGQQTSAPALCAAIYHKFQTAFWGKSAPATAQPTLPQRISMGSRRGGL